MRARPARMLVQALLLCTAAANSIRACRGCVRSKGRAYVLCCDSVSAAFADGAAAHGMLRGGVRAQEPFVSLYSCTTAAV